MVWIERWVTPGAAPPPAIGQTALVLATGEHLDGFFDGLTPNPKFTAQNVTAAFEQMAKQGPRCTPRAKWSFLERLLSLVEPPSVRAQQQCYPSNCTGEYWADSTEPCTANCVGFYDTALPLSGPEHRGFRDTGTEGCNSSPGYDCPCERRACVAGPPPCPEPCSGSGYAGCPSGKRCNGQGCCEPCARLCDANGLCLSPAGVCTNGCCDPYTCSTITDCRQQIGLGYKCVNGVCEQYFCGFGQGYCTDQYDCQIYAGEYCDGLCCINPSPIVIDLEADGYHLTSAEHGVRFDIMGSGRPVQIAWTATGSDDVWLALDRNGNGAIDDGKELFGNATDQPDPPSAGNGKGKKDVRNGFAALNVFDQPAAGGNRDGWIDSRDGVFPALRLWRDINHNGVSEAGELSPLSGSSVTAISLDYKESKFTDAFGNQFRYRAKVVREGRGNGRDKWAYDVFLVVAPPGAPGS